MVKKEENLKILGEGELKAKLSVLEENVRIIRFKSEGARSKNVKEVKNLKREIARVLTEINKKKNEKGK